MSDNLIVSKFGGSSMADQVAMDRCAKIVSDYSPKVVLVSATYGTTDKLVALSEKAQAGLWDECETIIFDINQNYTKPQIKFLIEKIFKVRVKSVKTNRLPIHSTTSKRFVIKLVKGQNLNYENLSSELVENVFSSLTTNTKLESLIK